MNGDKWIQDNFHHISKWSKHWHSEEWGELISHFVIYVDKNWANFSMIPDGVDRIKFMQVWFKNNVQWKNSDFNKSIRTNNLPEEWDIKEEGEDQFLDVYCESDRDDIRDFMLDLYKKHSEHDVNRILMIRRAYIQLATHDKVLYDLYFTQMMSMRDIGKKLDLPLSAIYNMITELKNKIKESCGIQL